MYIKSEMKNSKVKLFTVATIIILIFNGLKAQTVTDIDGNVYNTVKIGDQTWMAENLRVKHFRNGFAIPVVADHTRWSLLDIGACCDYDNSPVINETFGGLYNHYAVVDARQLCPNGWHVPTDDQWTTLVTFLGDNKDAGVKLKEKSDDFWQSQQTNATNESGFKALPGGNREPEGSFAFIGEGGYWWSATGFSAHDALGRYLLYNSSKVYRYDANKKSGFSVRCIKD